MKRSIVIGLFLPLFYSQMGYYGQFMWQQWVLKEAAREARLATLPDGVFVRIDQAYVAAAGKWEERGREFSLNGHLFDVIRSRTAGNTTWLFCLDDENEERLDQQSSDVIRNSQDHPDKKTGHSFCVSIGDIFCECPCWSVPSPDAVLRQYFVLSGQPLPGRYPEFAGPPPKV